MPLYKLDFLNDWDTRLWMRFIKTIRVLNYQATVNMLLSPSSRFRIHLHNTFSRDERIPAGLI